MNKRKKAFWLPGLLVLAASEGSLELLQRVIPESWPHATPILPFLLWVIALPLLGALGAYLSLLLGGQRRLGLAAGLFPSTAIFAAWLLSNVWRTFLAKNGLIVHHPFHTAFNIFLWSVLPALALLLGAMLFLRPRQPQEL
jgi:hypothetical protein